MEFDPELLKQLVDTFKTELDEQLQVMIDGLLQLEKKSTNAAKQAMCFEAIFRAAHNIKGASKSLGINDVGDIAHHMESLFSALQKKEKIFSTAMVDLCFEAVDKLRLSMNCFLENQSITFDLDDLLSRLDSSSFIGDKPQKNILQKKTSKVKTQKIVEIPIKKISCVDRQSHETIRVSIESIGRVAALMEEMQVNKIAIEDHQEKLAKMTAQMKPMQQLWEQVFVQQSMDNKDELQKLHHRGSDRLNEVLQSLDDLNKNMHLRMNDLNVLFHALQEEIYMLRLIPAATLLQSLPRTIRDLANEMNKKVELIISGDDVKMDKMVLEGLKDPLIHLLRNAIDHGIEEPSVRKAVGKTDVGYIWLSVVEEGNQILLSITDDGAGIDTDKIKKQCEVKNLFSAADLERMGEKDLLELVFRPGFTTREIITNVSGRGVGLDVVKENIGHLKGHVSIDSTLRKGTTVELRVPLTLTSERGLIVRCSGQMLVIPTAFVDKVLFLKTNEIIEVGATQAILLDGHPIPLRDLADMINLEKREPFQIDKLSIVVIRKGWDAIAFLVDTIVGEREMVVKPLQTPVDKVFGVVGGTLSGNGQVMVVLNPGDIIKMALQGQKVSRVAVQNNSLDSQTKPQILIVDDSITTRTLEKSILESRGYQVTTAVDGKEAWDTLQKKKFSLLITDVVMPSVDGFTLTDRVKKTEKLQGMPVIIVTSLGSEAEKKRGIEVGADAYIVKSEFESGVLLEIVEQLV